MIRFPESALIEAGFLRRRCSEAVNLECPACGTVAVGLSRGDCPNGMTCETCGQWSPAPRPKCARCNETLPGTAADAERECLSVQAYRKGDCVAAFAPEEALWAFKKVASGPVAVAAESELRRRFVSRELDASVLVRGASQNDFINADACPEFRDIAERRPDPPTPLVEPTPSPLPHPVSTPTSTPLPATPPIIPIAPRSTNSGNGMGIASLVLGILSLVLCVWGMPLGIVAAVLATITLRRIKSGLAPEAALGLARAGQITGVISVVINVAVLILYGFMFSWILPDGLGKWLSEPDAKQQHQAVRAVDDPRTWEGIPAEVKSWIEVHAVSKYRDDYQMQDYEVRNGLEGYRAIKDPRTWEGIPAEVKIQIEADAASKSRDDYQMQDYQVRNDLESYRKTHRLR